eukprot:1816712-Prymnesium_polylepis.2
MGEVAAGGAGVRVRVPMAPNSREKRTGGRVRCAVCGVPTGRSDRWAAHLLRQPRVGDAPRRACREHRVRVARERGGEANADTDTDQRAHVQHAEEWHGEGGAPEGRADGGSEEQRARHARLQLHHVHIADLHPA